jgi:hypothetical protein
VCLIIFYLDLFSGLLYRHCEIEDERLDEATHKHGEKSEEITHRTVYEYSDTSNTKVYTYKIKM